MHSGTSPCLKDSLTFAAIDNLCYLLNGLSSILVGPYYLLKGFPIEVFLSHDKRFQLDRSEHIKGRGLEDSVESLLEGCKLWRNQVLSNHGVHVEITLAQR